MRSEPASTSRADDPKSRPRVGYVMKVYPRFSETFIVNEILAHEAAGQPLDLFSLRPPADGRFHQLLSQVKASVAYINPGSSRSAVLWRSLGDAMAGVPGLREHLPELCAHDVRDAVQAMELAHEIRRRGIAHLHAHFGSVATTVARLAARLTGISYSFTAHAKDIFHESVEEDDLRRKLADASAVVTVSDFNLAYFRDVYGQDAAGVRRLYNGLDLSTFRFRSPSERAPVIAAVGRLVEKKGFDVLLEACSLLARRGRDFRCLIVGAGEQEEKLHAQAAELGLRETVEFTGALPQEEVKQIIATAAALAVPCVVGEDGNRDGLPTVLLEAMALGTPCVSTPVTGIPEVVHDGETGLLVAEHDPAGLADALERLLTDSALRCRLAEPARAIIERDFDVHAQTGRLRELFAEVTRGEVAGAATRRTTASEGRI